MSINFIELSDNIINSITTTKTKTTKQNDKNNIAHIAIVCIIIILCIYSTYITYFTANKTDGFHNLQASGTDMDSFPASINRNITEPLIIRNGQHCLKSILKKGDKSKYVSPYDNDESNYNITDYDREDRNGVNYNRTECIRDRNSDSNNSGIFDSKKKQKIKNKKVRWSDELIEIRTIPKNNKRKIL